MNRKFKSGEDTRGLVGRSVRMSKSGGGQLMFCKRGEEKLAIGTLVRGARRGGVAIVQMKPEFPPAFEEPQGKMTPGPYTTCKKCLALVATSDVASTNGFCGNCYPSSKLEAAEKRFGTLRETVGAFVNAVLSGDALDKDLAMRDLVRAYLSDEGPKAKSDDD